MCAVLNSWAEQFQADAAVARRFVAASSQYLRAATPAVAGPPLTMACWICPASLADGWVAQSICAAAGDNRLQLWVKATTGLVVAQTTDASSTSATGAVAGVWSHIAGVFASDTSRIAYLNGAGATLDTTNSPVASLAETLIGARRNGGSLGGYWNGLIAFPYCWNAALSAGEIYALWRGRPPWTVRPQSIVSAPDLLNCYDPVLRAAWTPSASVPATAGICPQVRAVRRRLITFGTSRTPITDSRAFTWGVRQALTDARSPTWSVRQALGDSRSLTWGVRQALTDPRSLTWSVRGALADARSPTWSVRSALTDTRDFTWTVYEALTDARIFTWSVRQALTDSRALTWDTRKAIHQTRKFSWSVESNAAELVARRPRTHRPQSVYWRAVRAVPIARQGRHR